MDTQTLRQQYEAWLTHATEDNDLQEELRAIAGDDEQIGDRFYRELEFGTGGLRGVLGAGTNRMNVYTVGKATQGLADYLNARYTGPAVAISYDSRLKSETFARRAACVLAANGIKAYVFDELMPTPVLSYAVRTLSCQGGIMITASHNPSQYNGYKCYGDDGCQMTDDDAGAVTACIRRLDIFDDIRVMEEEEARRQGLILPVPASVRAAFLDRAAQLQQHHGLCRKVPLSVVYTPLNGTGNKPVRELLDRIGVQQVTVVPEQELPDGHFPTAPYPNPEFGEAYACALKLAAQVKPDLLLATDPDCDRVGLMVHDGDTYRLLTGNETGCLLLQYLLESRSAAGTLPTRPVVVKTIVTSDLVTRIAARYGCEVREVLTGFKYIGEQITLLAERGEADRYVLGFEESIGYLAGTHVRDKDAVSTSMLLCEMTAYYKQQGLRLVSVLDGLYREYGVFRHTQVNAAFEGAEGMQTMQRLMDGLRAQPPATVAGLKVVKASDYELSRSVDTATGAVTPLTLPRSNVLAFALEGGAGVIVRPSGTEPKIKAYITATGTTVAEAEALTERLTQAAGAMLKD